MEKQEGMFVCENMPRLPEDTVIAMAYIPFQTDFTSYDSDVALSKGTLFPELNKEFYGGKCFGEQM